MDLPTLKQNAYDAGQGVADMQTSAPTMLSQLKQNLVGIFAKDNPIMGARDTAVADYLSTPQRARADLLPVNMPQIEGRALTLSPTMQDAVVSSRNAASLVPAVGLNEIIKAQYGTIGDVVKNAGDIYTAQIAGAQSRASNALDLYKAAIAEEEARNKAAGDGGLDLAGIMEMIKGILGVEAPQNGPSLDDIFAIQGNQNQGAGQPDKKIIDSIINSPMTMPKPIDFSKIPGIDKMKINLPKQNTNPNSLTMPGSGIPNWGGLNLSGLKL